MTNEACELILASNSPRRRQLLGLLVDHFQVQPAHVDESTRPGEAPETYVLRLAEEKAREVGREAGAGSLIIAADTTVVDAGQILGKPETPAEAERILRDLRGRIHQVYTGLALFRPQDGNLLLERVESNVPMRHYTDAEIRAYVRTGDPFDKAGGYAIQHQGFHPVKDFQGCFANVMGLPICHLRVMLEQVGCPVLPDSPQRCQQSLDYDCPRYASILKNFEPCA